MDAKGTPRSHFSHCMRTLVLCNSTVFSLDFAVLGSPGLPQDPSKKRLQRLLEIKLIFLVFCRILVSTGFRDRGGKTHFCGSFCHHSHTECEFSKINPIKHMLFEAIFGASAHLGPPGPKMGPGRPPRSPKDPQNMIFYSLFIDPRAIFRRLGATLGFLSGCSE